MKFFMIGPYYLYWHYTRGISELSKNLFNFIIFQFHYFSVKDLIFTFFSPFQRLKEEYSPNSFEIEKILSTFVLNTLMRIVGMLVRSVLLSIAIICIVISLILVPIILLTWLILPVLLLFLFGGSLWAYIKYRR